MITQVQKDQIAADIAELWTEWKDNVSQKEEIWDDCDKHYQQNYLDTSDYENYDYRCTVSRPIIQETVDTVAASINNALFPANDDYCQVEGLDEIGKKHAKTIDKEFKQLLFKSRFVARMEPFIKQTVLVGNSTGAVYNETVYRSRRRWQNGATIREKVAISDFPIFKHQDIFSVAFPTDIEEYIETIPRIHRTVVPLIDVRARRDLYNNVGDLKNKDKVFLDVPDAKRQQRAQRFGINKQRSVKKGNVELMTFFGDLKIGRAKHKEDQMLVCGDREVVLRQEENPYWCGSPHVFARYSSVPGQFFGRGVAEPILGLQELIDTFSCQKADVINLILGGFWAIAPDPQLDLTDLTAQPQGVILLRDVNNIKSLAPSANPTLAFSEIGDLRDEADRSSGASRFTQGIPAPGRRTATEAMQIGQGTSARFNNIITGIGEQAVEPALNMKLQQFFQFNAYNYPGIPNEAWEGRYCVKFNGAKQSVVREITMQLFLNYMQIVINSEALVQFVDPRKLITELTKLFNVDADTILKTDAMFGEPGYTPDIVTGSQGSELDQFGGAGPQQDRILEGITW